MKFLGEFKEFINRGNVMDLAVAVAVIIGGAFASIVTALTTNIINPLISGQRGYRFWFGYTWHRNRLRRIYQRVRKLSYCCLRRIPAYKGGEQGAGSWQ